MFAQRSISALCLLAAAALSPFRAMAQSNTAPTASESAESLADVWQKATAKYDGPRSAILADVDRGTYDGPFRPDWNSLSQYKVPDWYRDAKFGIFIHWGVYSVPAFGSEWYPREMYLQGSEVNQHHVSTYGPLTRFGYKDFIPMFKAQKYDPQAWAHLFKESGARYVVPVFEHHDGFQMYDSNLSDWTAVKMGPHRDLAGDLEKAVRGEGLYFGASSHRIEHDWFMDGGRSIPSDVNDPQNASLYGPAQIQLQDKKEGNGSNLEDDWTYVSSAYANDWLARDAEIVQKYHPDIIFFDWWIGQPYVRSYLAKFAAYYLQRIKQTRARGDHYLQVGRHAERFGCAGHRTRPARPKARPGLANRHFGQQQVLGLHRARHLQNPGVHRPSARRHCEQKWKPVDEHRAPFRRHHSR